jgi:hypothetical protein
MKPVYVRCPHCGESTFTIEGWVEVDHCRHCGRPLPGRRVNLQSVMDADRRRREERLTRRRRTTG